MVFHAFGKEFQLIYFERYTSFFSSFIFAVILSLKLKKKNLPKASLKQWPAEVNNSKFGGLKCILARCLFIIARKIRHNAR